MEISFGDEAREKIKNGVDKLADSVKCTLGPRGRHAAIQRGSGSPLITKDGVTVARSIVLEDPLENMGAQIVKEVASNTNFLAGDGTTTATVLAQKIFNSGYEGVKMGLNPVLIKRGMDIALKKALGLIDLLKIDIDGDRALVENIAKISANNDEDLGKLIADVMFKVGTDGMISVEEGYGETRVDYGEGFSFERGMVSPAFITNHALIKAELDDCLILLCDKDLTKAEDVISPLKAASVLGKPLLIVANNISGSALTTLAHNKSTGAANVCAVRSPGFGDVRREMLEDIAVLTSAKLVTSELFGLLANKDLNVVAALFGSARRIVAGRNETRVLDGVGDESKVDERIDNIKKQLNDSTLYDHQIAALKQRLSKLSEGVALFLVGGSSESEVREKKDRVEDAINAVQSALEGGVVPGGGSGFLLIHNELRDAMPKSLTQEEAMGYKAVLDSIREPFMQISKNAGVGIEVYSNLIDIMNSGNKRKGYDALNLIMIEDMVAEGIIDPAKVLKSALKNAVSSCGTLLTTEVAIYTKNE